MSIKTILKPIVLTVFSAFAVVVSAQTGSETEPVRYVGSAVCNPRLHDGGLPYAIGTENIQVVRANRTEPQRADNYGWTYNHAPMITYWNNRFYVEYLSNPADEQQPPGHTLIATSADGRHWEKPIVVFPEYKAPPGVGFPKPYYGYIMHQRMGFYTAPNGKLLVVGFYGHSYDPFKEGGIGRVVREIRADGSLSDIYFIRYSSHAQWNETNTSYPFYTQSADSGFREACQSLLNDKLRTLQWIDEDRGLDGFYPLKDSVNTVQATSYFHRKDGMTVALWKWSYAALSPDNGQTWSKPVRCQSLIMAGGKNWGQQTDDHRYAMCYNPIETQPYRYPLVCVTSDNGIAFDSMCVVHGEVPPRRFFGENKDFGPCYVRGICEGEQRPDDGNMWLTYSVNKEDIWVSRVPLPVKTQWKGNIDERFSHKKDNSPIDNWNIYRPQWADIKIDNHLLCIADSDRYDYARATRVFETSTHSELNITMKIDKEGDEPFFIELTDGHGSRFMSLKLWRKTVSTMQNGIETAVGKYAAGKWFELKIDANTAAGGTFSVNNGTQLKALQTTNSIERLNLQTGAYRDLPNRQTPNQEKCEPLPLCDLPATPTLVRVKRVAIKKIG